MLYLNAIFMLLFKKYSKAKRKITEYVSSLGGLRPCLLKSKTWRNCSWFNLVHWAISRLLLIAKRFAGNEVVYDLVYMKKVLSSGEIKNIHEYLMKKYVSPGCS